MKRLLLSALLLAGMSAGTASAADLVSKLTKGTAQLGSAGPIAFAPEGILLAADPKNATIVAIATGDVSASSTKTEYAIEKLDEKIAAALGSSTKELQIVDIATNPISGSVYVSVARGRGPDATAVLLRVKPDGQIEEVATKNVPTASAKLPNAASDNPNARTNPRTESITDLVYVDGKIFIAGLSNEEFASNLRSVAFPFAEVSPGTSIEIFHGAHGAVETRSPVRTFAAYKIDGQDYLVAAYTCTPLVKIPVADLKAGQKVRGVTVAELGNRNRPLDMMVYKKDGKDFILMANSARGVMKISTEKMATQESISSRVADTAGLGYEKIESLAGVEQLDRLSDALAVVLVRTPEGSASLKSIALP
ncbi:MAG: hypothetical protein IT423_21895 [Pirellulaceae bacterium]|nr:hypothetical protein [Pirellulaceae bacterium]